MPRRDLSWITKTYFYDFEDISVINTGWCYVWAWLARLRYPRAELWVFDDADHMHAFVRVGNLWYDAERPKGVNRISDLPFFQDHDIVRPWENAYRFSDQSYQEAWGRMTYWNSQRLPMWPTALPPRPELDRDATVAEADGVRAPDAAASLG